MNTMIVIITAIIGCALFRALVPKTIGDRFIDTIERIMDKLPGGMLAKILGKKEDLND